MSTGRANPLPFRTGSGPTPTEQVYGALKSAVGPGNQGPDGGLRDLWRWCVAQALARATRSKDLAVAQAFPATMTVHLEAEERILNLPRAKTDAERRRAVGAAKVYQPDATGPNLTAELRKIDPAFVLDEAVPWALQNTSIPGKPFGPLAGDPGPVFGQGQTARRSAPFCNASDAFTVRVRYVLGPAQTEIPIDVYNRAVALLNDLVPFYCDFEIYNVCSGSEGDGFYLDGGPSDALDGTSLLDMTAL